MDYQDVVPPSGVMTVLRHRPEHGKRDKKETDADDTEESSVVVVVAMSVSLSKDASYSGPE